MMIIRIHYRSAHPLLSPVGSRFNERERRSDGTKVSCVSCDDALKTAGKGSDQNISDRTLRHLHGFATNLMVVPQPVCQFGVSDGPWFRCRDRDDLEEIVRGARISAESRPYLDKCDGANAQAIGEMFLKACERRSAPGRVGHDQVQNHRGIDHPGHLVALTLPEISQRFIRRTPWGRWQFLKCGIDPLGELSKRRHLGRRAGFIRQRNAYSLALGETAQQTGNNASAVVANADGRVDRAHACHTTLPLAS